MKLQEIRKQAHMTQASLAKELGVSRSTVAMWETGNCEPSQDILLKICDIFDVSTDYLLGKEMPAPPIKKKINILRVPVYGQVAAGVPIEAIEDIEDYEELDADQYPSGEYIALRIHGHSMEPRMMEGDIVIVRLQEDVNTGDTAIVMVNGGEATCKKIKKTLEGVFLISTNPAFEPMFYSKQEVLELPVRVLGKVVELRAKY